MVKTFVAKDYIDKNFYKNYFDSEKILKKAKYMKNFGFTQEANGKITLEHNRFSKIFLRHVKVVSISSSRSLAIYNVKRNIYELDSEETISKLIKYFFDLISNYWTPNRGSLVYKTIVHDNKIAVSKFNSGTYINLIDGVLNLENFQLYEHSPDYY